jgi:hypothetical protein
MKWDVNTSVSDGSPHVFITSSTPTPTPFPLSHLDAVRRMVKLWMIDHLPSHFHVQAVEYDGDNSPRRRVVACTNPEAIYHTSKDMMRFSGEV